MPWENSESGRQLPSTVPISFRHHAQTSFMNNPFIGWRPMTTAFLLAIVGHATLLLYLCRICRGQDPSNFSPSKSKKPMKIRLLNCIISSHLGNVRYCVYLFFEML